MLTAKQEHFARAFVELGKGPDAYVVAFDAENMAPHSIEVEASKLLHNPDIALRIKELRDAGAEVAKVTVASVLQELEAVRLLAVDPITGSLATANAAILGKAKVAGLIVDQSKLTASVVSVVVPPLSAEAALLIKAVLEAERF